MNPQTKKILITSISVLPFVVFFTCVVLILVKPFSDSELIEPNPPPSTATPSATAVVHPDSTGDHPHPHPLRFRSPDELRVWRVYVASALRGRSFWNLSDVISVADRTIRAERERKPILRPKRGKAEALSL